MDRKSIVRELEPTIEYPDAVAEAITTYRLAINSRIYEIRFYVHACRSITLRYWNGKIITTPSNECRLMIYKNSNTIIDILLISEYIYEGWNLLRHPQHKWNIRQRAILERCIAFINEHIAHDFDEMKMKIWMI